MAEYIDREALMKFPIRANRCDKEHANKHFINGIESVMEYAELLPTVDAVPVVRCKDCKKLGTGECPMEQDYPWISTDSDDFCSYGERRENDEGRN
mgnify:CR=1 FL=1